MYLRILGTKTGAVGGHLLFGTSLNRSLIAGLHPHDLKGTIGAF